jgi:hypothetical protein
MLEQKRSAKGAGVSVYELLAYAAAIALVALAADALLANDSFAIKSIGLVIGLVDILAGMFAATIALIELFSRFNFGSFGHCA